jgi:hypothetical protein
MERIDILEFASAPTAYLRPDAPAVAVLVIELTEVRVVLSLKERVGLIAKMPVFR